MNITTDEALFASIQHSPMATVITDCRLPDNPIVAANEAFRLLTGYADPDILGRNCRFLAGPGTEAAASATLRDACNEGRSAFTELLNYKADGTSFRNAVMIAPVFDAEGRLAYFLGSQMDAGPTDERSTARRLRARDQVAGLTPRQRQVLAQMTQGNRNKQIAARLELSEKTVKMHRASLLARLEVPTSADAVRIAVEAGL